MNEQQIIEVVYDLVLVSLEIGDRGASKALLSKRTKLRKKLSGISLAEVNRYKGIVWDRLRLENSQKYGGQ